jgi:hypothetical protein
MIAAEPIGLWNTGVPLLVLCALALGLPRLTVPRATRDHGAVLRGIALAAVLVLLAGVVVFVAAYGLRGAEVARAATVMPVATALLFLRLSGLSALVWGPLLALVWLGQAQAVEARRGEDAMREGRG